MTPVAPATDTELASSVIHAGVAGDPAAEAELCRRFGRRIRLYGRRRMRDSSAIDDLVQRVMLLVITKLRQGDVHSPERIDSFILGTARIVSHELSRPGEQSAALDAELPCALTETEPDVFERERLGECLQKLTERDRSVVALTFFHERTADEVGRALGMDSGNVRVTRHRALSRLRGCMGLGSEEASP